MWEIMGKIMGEYIGRVAIIRLGAHRARRVRAARRMAALGYPPFHIAACLGLSLARVTSALADGAGPSLWGEGHRADMAAEMGRC